MYVFCIALYKKFQHKSSLKDHITEAKIPAEQSSLVFSISKHDFELILHIKPHNTPKLNITYHGTSYTNIEWQKPRHALIKNQFKNDKISIHFIL